MDKLSAIIQIINTTGFPIFCVLALGWYVKSVMDKIEQSIIDMRLVVEKNTFVIEKLTEKLGEKNHEGISE